MQTLVRAAYISKMFVKIANRKYPDQTAKQSDLGLHCLSKLFCKQLVFENLEQLFIRDNWNVSCVFQVI